MKKIGVTRVLSFMAWIILFFYTLSAAALPADTSRRVIVFGDSYSDNGNVYALTHGRYPNAVAYYHGRFSNGLVWAEYLAKRMGIAPTDSQRFLDFAYGQAKILSPTSIVVFGHPNQSYPIPSFSDEIDRYQWRYKKIMPKDWVIVFISTNDFFDPPVMDVKTDAFFLKAANQEVEQIHRLIKLGAEHIIVLNGRDVTLSPLFKGIASHYAGSSSEKFEQYSARMRHLIKLYNAALAQKLSRDSAVSLYDVFAFDERMTHKMKNLKMCYENPQGDYQHVAGPICSRPARYFYYDRIHTTRTVNAMLADAVYRQIQ